MDYKEKYEEAMEVMRQWIAPCHTKEQLETLKKSVFPELNEPEDERIRKELIFFLKEEIPQCSIKEHADKLNQFVSYLEKQKPAQNDNDDEVKTLKIKEGHWYACVNDVYLDGKRVYSKGDIVKANKFMATLNERSAAYSFRPVFFPYRQPEEFCNDLQCYPIEQDRESESKIERLLFLISLALEQNYISESECVNLRNFVSSFKRKK